MSIYVDKSDLKPGQWVLFSHETNKLTPNVSTPFRVVSKNDFINDPCCCTIMNQEGVIGEFCTRINSIHSEYLPDHYNIRVLTTEQAKKLLGKKYDALEKKANLYLRNFVLPKL